jgi:hypothetical protein
VLMMEPDDDHAGVVTPGGTKKKAAEGDSDRGKKTKKSRKVHSLPLEFALLTDCDREKFNLVLEIDKTHRSATYGQEFLVAKSVSFPSTNSSIDDQVLKPAIDLCSLSVENLRKLCINLGISNTGSFSKFNCPKAIAIYFWYQESLANIGIRPTSHASRVTSTVCRAVNVVFSADFIEDFKTVNDRKSRQDHETKNTYKAFWIRAAVAYNACMQAREDETEIVLVEKSTSPAKNGEIVVGQMAHAAKRAISFPDSDDSDDYGSNASLTSGGGGGKPLAVDTGGVREPEDEDEDAPIDDFGAIVVYPLDDEHLLELSGDPDINLFSVDQTDTKAFTKKIMTLFAVRRKMQSNMTVSGTHESDPWHFVENAMLGTTGLNKISVYYFYQRCEQNKDIDSNFQPFLDMSMRGDSVSEWDEMDDSPATRGSKKDAEAASVTVKLMKGIVDQGSTLLKHFETNVKHSEASDQLARKRVQFYARLDVAKAIGNQDKLLILMEEAKTLADK